MVALRGPARDAGRACGLLYTGYARPYDGQSQGIVYLRSADGALRAIDARLGVDRGAVGERGAACTTRGCRPTAQCDGPIGNADCRCRDGPRDDRDPALGSRPRPTARRPPPGPRAAAPSSSATWQGTETFAFAATDDGSGVHRAILEVDGAPVLARTMDDWGGRCVDTTAGERVFTLSAAVPRRRRTRSWWWTPARCPAGEHDMALRVPMPPATCAPCTRRARRSLAPGGAIGPGASLAERGAANGDDAADATCRTGRPIGRAQRIVRSSTRYGVQQRHPRAAARTRPAPVYGGARIELRQRDRSSRRGEPLDKGGARTRTDGRFTLIVRAARCRGRCCCATADTPRTQSRRPRRVLRTQGPRRSRARAVSAARRGQARRHGTARADDSTGRPLPAGREAHRDARRDALADAWITFRTVRARLGSRDDSPRRTPSGRGGPARYELRARGEGDGRLPASRPGSRGPCASACAERRPATVPRP